MRWTHSLRWRLTLLVGVVITLTIGGFAGGVYGLLQRTLLQTVDRQLHERATLMNQAVATDDLTLPDPPMLLLPPPLVELTTPGLYVAIIGPQDQVQRASSDLPAGYVPRDPALLAAARAGTPRLITITVGDDAQLRMLLTAVAPARQPGTVLVVAESLEPLQRMLAQTRTLIVIGGLIGVIAAVGGTILATRRLLAPIREVTQTAHAVATTQHYQRRIPLPHHDDELAQLVTTINTLISTVDATLEQQRQLVADTSHELRSPLTVVLANLSLLRRDLALDERELSVAEATTEAQRMRRLINDLLLLSQPATTQVLEVQPVELSTLMTTIMHSITRQAPAQCVTWSGGPAIWVMGDRERLTQLVRNVVENAIQHTSPATQITVTLSAERTWAIIAVADNGPGVAAEHLVKIWHRFYRVNKARSRGHGGSGLGLTIVNYLVAAHGGTVEVASSVGVGTTFTIRLPSIRNP